MFKASLSVKPTQKIFLHTQFPHHTQLQKRNFDNTYLICKLAKFYLNSGKSKCQSKSSNGRNSFLRYSKFVNRIITERQ